LERLPNSEPIVAADSLGVIADVRRRSGEALELASHHLDSSLVDVLRILGFDETYTHARGSHIYDAAGRAYLDLHSGEGFASLGHNNPDVREVLEAVLAEGIVDGVQIHYSVLAGMLAQELTQRLPGGLDAVFFASTGAEAVDSAMKFARAASGRARFLSCESSFHGVTLGPLSLVGDDFFKEGFGPLLPGCARVPFGDLDRLERELASDDVAAFIVEPIQGRKVTLPPEDYLREAQELCRRHGTLFVVDEIQTGLGRTGSWFALEQWGLQPDMVLVGKALSGGYMPVAAMVTTRAIFDAAVGTLERSYVHQSTYGRNRLSMAAGLAALRIIERDRLLEHVATVSGVLFAGLAELQGRYELLGEVRGRGLMIGIELREPRSRVARLNWQLIHRASEGLFGQLIVIPLHRDHRVITMVAGKNDVIKLLPPLTLSVEEANTFLGALDSVLADCAGAGGKNWGVVRDIATATLRNKARRRDAVPAAAQAPAFDPMPRERDGRDVCLVTGATGFIGGRLAERLAADGYHVRCLVRPSSNTEALGRLDVELAIGDLTTAGSLERAAKDCRFVFHCGARVSDWATPAEIARVNVEGTRNVMAAAASNSVERVIHFSTTDVYGYPGYPGVEETHVATRFRNWYAQTKLAAEAEIRRLERIHSLDTVILRPATVYGPHSIEVVGEIARAMRGGNMLLVDRGRAVAGLCYVDNVVDAAVLAASHADAPGHAFNVTDGLAVTWKQFTDGLAEGLGYPQVRWSLPFWLANAIGFSLEHAYRAARRTTRLELPPLLSRQAVHVLGHDQDFSSRKARDILGWQPRVDYATGLAATVDWLQNEHAQRVPARLPH
jgi:acetylornithine/succinyldiaminopimelate/putrescine aminotransferase/nucleoside-diphosphate-sugar epimerase